MKLQLTLSALAGVLSGGLLAQDGQPHAVPAPRDAPTDATTQGPDIQTGERVPVLDEGIVETMEEVLLRESLWDPSTQLNRRARNGRPGEWVVPGFTESQFPHSGSHYVTNLWGDIQMGIGFGQPVDLAGAWFSASGGRGAWAKGLQVVGYRDGVQVARSGWFRDVDETPGYFVMDLSGVDRIEIVAEAAFGVSGWYALDDLTYRSRATGREVLVDFEDLEYGDELSGSGYAGLTWEQGSGPLPPPPSDDAAAVQAPGGGGNAPGGGGGIGAGETGTGQSVGGGTLPILIKKFQGPKMFDPGANTFPPDTCGSVGIDHFVTVVNTNISVYQKSNGQRVVNMSLNSFFGVGGFHGDPRVVFDPDSQRFFVIMTNFSNRIRLAVSSTSDPTGSWFKTSWLTNLGGDVNKTPDYPTLGVDQRGVYVAAAQFGAGLSMTLWALEKAPLVAAAQSMGTNTAFRGLPYEGAIQPAVHWEDAGLAYAVSVSGSNRIRVRRIIPPITNPTLSNNNFVILSVNFSAPPDAPALGSNINLDTVGTRLMNAVYRVGSLWTAHCTKTGGRASSRWYELDPAGLSEIQLGTVRDNVNNEEHYFFPTIAVNDQKHVVLGGTVSDANQWAGGFYTGRLASDPPGEMAHIFEYRLGAGPYNRVDGFGRNRWGDYSLTSPDPTNDKVWTMQEWARTGNQWGTNIAKLGFDDCAGDIVRYCDPSVLGTSIDVDTCSLSVGSINVTYSGGTPGMVGFLLVGDSNGVINNPPGATGDLCLGGGVIGRYLADLAVIDGNGQIVTDIINGNTGGGVGNLPNPPGGSIQAGDTWNFQYWARHMGVSSTFSDAMSVTFK